MPFALTPNQPAYKTNYTHDGRGWEGARGTVYQAKTHRGRPIKVWVPDSTTPPNQRYFCHGYSLGTFNEHGYSVFSGHDVMVVLLDEYRKLQGLNEARAGDVVAFRDEKGFVIHTCLVINSPIPPNNAITAANLWVRTKNGPQAEFVCQLKTVMSNPAYGTRFELWRKRA